MHAQVGRGTQPGIERIREPAKKTVGRKIGMARTEDHPVVNQMIAEKGYHGRYQHVERHPEQMFAQDEQMSQEGRLLGSIFRCILFAHRPRYAFFVFRSVVLPGIDSVFPSLAPFCLFCVTPPAFPLRSPCLFRCSPAVFHPSSASFPPFSVFRRVGSVAPLRVSTAAGDLRPNGYTIPSRTRSCRWITPT